MRKKILKERFQQLAGIIPLYEQDDISSTGGDMKVKYEIIQQTEDKVKDEVKNDVNEITTKIESKKGEIIKHITDTYNPTEIAKWVISAPKDIATVLGGGLGNMTNTKTKVKILKWIFGNYMVIAITGLIGLKVDMTKIDTVAKTIPGESKNWIEKLWTWDSSNWDPKTFHQDIWGEGEFYYYLALGMFIFRIMMEYKQSINKEGLEGKDDVLKAIMGMIDADTDMIIKTLKTRETEQN